MDKILPKEIEIEAAVIGSLLIDRNSQLLGFQTLQTDYFTLIQHRTIIESLIQMNESGTGIDVLTVSNYLKSKNLLQSVGGVYELMKLSNSVSSSTNIEYYIAVLREKWIRRELITKYSTYLNNSFNESIDIYEVLESNQSSIIDIIENDKEKKARHVSEHLQKYTDVINNRIKTYRSGGISGVPSGFQEIDNATGGWQKSDLIILAARPSMGKTANALQQAINAVNLGYNVGFFSLEMSSTSLLDRVVAIETLIDNSILRKGCLTNEQIETLNFAVEQIAQKSLFIDDSAVQSINELRMKAKLMKAKNKIDIIFIDYLQLISGLKDGNREHEISSISRGLKQIARELDIPVIALSQLSREVEKRSDKKPQLSDLRESGAIEQDADVVCFLFRPEYYGFKEDQDGNPLQDGLTVFDIAKNRQGALASINLIFNKNLTKFEMFFTLS